MGKTISRKIEAAEWGDGIVPQLAQYIARTQPGIRGFTRANLFRNLFRMRQFYETYRDGSIVAALLRQLPWTHHLIILGQSKHAEEREFYIRMAIWNIPAECFDAASSLPYSRAFVSNAHDLTHAYGKHWRAIPLPERLEQQQLFVEMTSDK